ncbi:MAG: VOC family protein [Chloroflexi bacterium]|nr:VOC family protein [Chloroflexota bacterium]
MTVALDHMSIPARDKVATAEFYARVFGVRYAGPRRDFAPVALSEGLTLNFEQSEVPEVHHYAFRVDNAEFDSVLERLRATSVPFGSTTSNKDSQVYDRAGVRGFYFEDPNGHGLEVITRQSG